MLLLSAFMLLPSSRPAYATGEGTSGTQGTTDNTDQSDQDDRSIQDPTLNDFGYVDGYLPVQKEIKPSTKKQQKRLLRAPSYPASYRSDEQPWAASIKVKNQLKTGLCWAFALTTTGEYSYAKELYDTTGQVSQVPELSPALLGFFLFNRVDDPLGGTPLDYTDWGEDNNKIWPILGNTLFFGAQHLATFSGFASEEKAPFAELNSKIKPDNTFDDTYVPYDNALAYDDVLLLQESYLLDEYDSGKIKELVLKYGAVAASTFMHSNTFNGETSHYDFYSDGSGNHAITIVGWDDDYPKENFTHTTNTHGQSISYMDLSGKKVTLTEEEARTATTPPGNGAWIVQNSYGSEFGASGFFYISYYSYDLQPWFVALDLQPEDSFAYNFQYDGTVDCGDTTDSGNEAFLTVKGTKAANVFTNTTGEPVTIDGVGFTCLNSDPAGFDVSVYTGLTDASDPTNGILAGTTHVSTDMPQISSVTLDTPVTVGVGEQFSIVCSFKADVTAMGIEKSRISLAYHYVHTDPNQSFFLGKDKTTWVDMNDYKACFRIKALANALTAPAKYTVQFTDGQGNLLETQTIASGKAATAPSVPTRDGYILSGWDKDISNVTGNMIVNAVWTPRKKLVITANDLSKVYGEKDPKLTYTVEGLADGETLNGSLARKGGENAGSYQITLGTLASDPVYDVTFTEGTFTIQKKKLKASELSVKEKPAARKKLVEDGTGQTLVEAPAQLPEGYTKVLYSPDNGKTWSAQLPAATDAGTYPVMYKFVGDKNHIDYTGGPITAKILGKKEEPDTEDVTEYDTEDVIEDDTEDVTEDVTEDDTEYDTEESDDPGSKSGGKKKGSPDNTIRTDDPSAPVFWFTLLCVSGMMLIPLAWMKRAEKTRTRIKKKLK